MNFFTSYLEDLELFLCIDVIDIVNITFGPKVILNHNIFACKNLRDVFPNFLTLLTIFLTAPATSCESERSFSVLKRFKSFQHQQ